MEALGDDFELEQEPSYLDEINTAPSSTVQIPGGFGNEKKESVQQITN